MITKEAFVDLQEKFNKVIKLIVDDSKLDPESEPYLSKYNARAILLNMKANLENIFRNPVHPPDNKDLFKLRAMIASVHLYLGIVYIDTEELSTGETHLEKSQELIKDDIDKPEVIMISLNLYNQFGILWSQREPEKSKFYLEKSEQLYLDYKKSNIPPLDINDLFQANLEQPNVELAWQNFEKIYTFTLYYLAQIYGALKDALRSSIYCHITLQRQLDSKEYDPIDWALNAATLSQFFMEKNGFKQARHHLSASSYILDKYKRELDAIAEHNEAYEAKMENFKHRSADVARCWAKYGLLLLSKSKERLLNHTDDIDENCTVTSDFSNLNINEDSTVSQDEIAHLEFASLDLAQYENQITHKYILTIQDARVVFLNIHTWLNKAESYYTLENLASDHIEIVQDQSQMYHNLLFFEDNSENQAKLHKRRADLLENVISKINPQYYLQYCRQIWFELAQIYNDILNIKTDKLRETDQRPSPHALVKINHLIDHSINNFQAFIDSFKEGPSKELPPQVHPDFEKPFLQAYFHIAALSSRHITLDKHIQLTNIEKSYEYYKKVYEYCEINKKAQELLPMEFGLCKEMANLLPVKIAKLRSELN